MDPCTVAPLLRGADSSPNSIGQSGSIRQTKLLDLQTRIVQSLFIFISSNFHAAHLVNYSLLSRSTIGTADPQSKTASRSSAALVASPRTGRTLLAGEYIENSSST